MTTLIIEGLAALNLLFFAGAVSTQNLRSAIVFKTAPAALGVALGGLAFGRFMGWPV